MSSESDIISQPVTKIVSAAESRRTSELPWPVWNANGSTEMCINGLPLSNIFQNINIQLETLRSMINKRQPVSMVQDGSVSLVAGTGSMDNEIISTYFREWTDEKQQLESRLSQLESAVEQNDKKAAEKDAALRLEMSDLIAQQCLQFQMSMQQDHGSSMTLLTDQLTASQKQLEKSKQDFQLYRDKNDNTIVSLNQSIETFRSEYDARNVGFQLQWNELQRNIQKLTNDSSAMNRELNELQSKVNHNSHDLNRRIDELVMTQNSFQSECRTFQTLIEAVREEHAIYVNKFKTAEGERMKLGDNVRRNTHDLATIKTENIPELRGQISTLFGQKADHTIVDMKASLESVSDVRNEYQREFAQCYSQLELLKQALNKQDELVMEIPTELHEYLDEKIEQMTKWSEAQIKHNNDMVFNYQKSMDGGGGGPHGTQSAAGFTPLRCLVCHQSVSEIRPDTRLIHDPLRLTTTVKRDGSPTHTHSHTHIHPPVNSNALTSPHVPYFNANTTAVGEDQQRLLQDLIDSVAQHDHTNHSAPAKHPPKFSKLVRLLAVTNEQVGGVNNETGNEVITDEPPPTITTMTEQQMKSPLHSDYSTLIAQAPKVISNIHNAHKSKDFVSWRPLMANTKAKSQTQIMNKSSSAHNNQLQQVNLSVSTSKLLPVRQLSEVENSETSALKFNIPMPKPRMIIHTDSDAQLQEQQELFYASHHGQGHSLLSSNSHARPSSAPSTRRHHTAIAAND